MDRFQLATEAEVKWLALRCADEGCSVRPSRSSQQEDEPWRIIERRLSESMAVTLSPRCGDFNENLRQLGVHALRAALRLQLAPEDAARFMGR